MASARRECRLHILRGRPSGTGAGRLGGALLAYPHARPLRSLATLRVLLLRGSRKRAVAAGQRAEGESCSDNLQGSGYK